MYITQVLCCIITFFFLTLTLSLYILVRFLLCFFFFFSSRRRHTRLQGDWSSDVCSSDLSRRDPSAPACRRRRRPWEAGALRAATASLRLHAPPASLRRRSSARARA